MRSRGTFNIPGRGIIKVVDCYEPELREKRVGDVVVIDDEPWRIRGIEMKPSPLPPDLVAALTVPRPCGKDWDRVVELVDYHHDGLDVAAVKQHLGRWPRELPRPAAKHWTATLTGRRRDAVLSLCLDVDEVDTYPLYVEALCVKPPPGLRLRNGQPAMTLWRQPRGTVELADGSKLALNNQSPGMGDLGGPMVVEWERRGVWHEVEMYAELEVKLDGRIPPGAVEYVGDSKRQLTPTERDQVQRQRVRTARGGVYLFADSVADAVDRFVAIRAEITRRLA